MEREPTESDGNSLSEGLQQRQNELLNRYDSLLAARGLTEEEKQKERGALHDVLDSEDSAVRRLKDISSVQEHMRRSRFDDPVEWLIYEGDIIPPPPGFSRFKPPLAPWRRELHQLYRDKVKEVVRHWREKGFL